MEDQLEALEQQEKEEVSDSQSLSASVKKMFDQEAEDVYIKKSNTLPLPEDKTVYELAAELGLTVLEYVQRDPEYAVRVAENELASWMNLLSNAAAKGYLEMENPETGELEEYSVSKNQAKMIEVRVAQAQKQLDYVQELSFTAYKDGEQKKDLLLRNMYHQALRGNSRLAIYLIDRVDGRPTESKQNALDYDNAYNIYMIVHTLFEKQLEVLNSGNGTKLICCSRRAGKTHLLVAILLIEALRRPNTTCIYIGETMELSEGLIDKAANDIIEACHLKDSKGKRFNWKRIDNGSRILVRGLSNTKDPDQIRGNSAKVIVIDEFFHLKGELLQYLYDQVLQPMQMDYADDYKFICAGTPPSIKHTFGEYAWRNWDVEKFTWTWRDNPHPVDVEARQEYVDNILKEKGLTWDTPFARREYNGEWAYDDDLVLYPEYHCYDPREYMPTMHVDMVLFGIDYGVGDNDTLIGIAWDAAEGRGYVFWEDKFNRLDIKDRTISQLQYLRGQVRSAWRTALDFFKNMSPFEANKRILWDADDNDQHLTDDMNVNVRFTEEGYQDLRLNIQNAHKTDKVIMQDKIKDLLRTAGLLLIKDGKTAEECDKTVLKRGPNGEVLPEVDNKVYHPDLLPAMRYALVNVLGEK
jgi:hypothetical protein